MKRAEALRALSREHNEALVLARNALRAAGSGSPEWVACRWRELATAWHETMAQHFATEERLLFPVLRELGATGLADRLLREHRAIERALGDPARWDAQRLEALGTVLRAHVRREEREAFPLLERHAGEEQLATVAAAESGTG